MLMTNEKYKQVKLNIFESADANTISAEEKTALLSMLEEAKEASTLSEDDIKDFLKALAEQFPAVEDDVKKLGEKLKKEAKGEDESEYEGKDEEKKDDEEKDPEEDEAEVSEAAKDIAQILRSYF